MERLTKSIRPFIATIGVFSVFFAPPYMALICILLLSLRFRAWEAMCIGVLMDLVWLPDTSFFILPLYTCAAILVVWALEPLRVQLLR